jgi:hypothetical protein
MRAARQAAANKDAVIDTLITKIQECEKIALSLKSSMGPSIVAAPVAPASRKPTEFHEGLQDHPLLSNKIDEVNDYIKGLLESGDKEYTQKSGRKYECNVGGKNIVLECMRASGNNLDCFVHSFLTAVFPAFRSAVASEWNKKGGSRKFEKFATLFRKSVIHPIVDYSNKKGIIGDKVAKDTLTALLADNTELPDDLIPCLCYYYNIRILLFGSPSKYGNKLPTARLIGEGQDIYAISNPDAHHFEPCRLQGTQDYTLTDEQSNCFTSKYIGSQTSKEMIEREQAIIGIDYEKSGKSVVNGGIVTQLYKRDDKIVRYGEGLYDQATALKKSDWENQNTGSRLDDIQTDIREIEIDYAKGDIEERKARAALQGIQERIKTLTSATKKGGKRRVHTHRKKHRTGFRRISSQNRRR